MINRQSLKTHVNDLLSRTGYKIQRIEPQPTTSPSKVKAAGTPRRAASLPADTDPAARQILASVTERTMTGSEKLLGLIEATRYISRHEIEGDVVECGVWRGGSMMTVAHTLTDLGDTSFDLHLFDTYDGMSEPSDHDRRIFDGRGAQQLLDASPKTPDVWVWAYATLEDVEAGMNSTSYPVDKIHYVKGKVEETIPDHAPEKISLLRLDTDWYESTKHELEHLYDRVSAGGVIVFDDYGYWEGARTAVDEFIERTGSKLLLNRVGSGRMAIKLHD